VVHGGVTFEDQSSLHNDFDIAETLWAMLVIMMRKSAVWFRTSDTTGLPYGADRLPREHQCGVH